MPARRFTAYIAAILSVAVSSTAHGALGMERLTELSLAELSDIEVTSVSKSAEPLREAPASIYVITHDEIVRAGVPSIAEALRLAPNLHISQYSSNTYIAGARGFAGAQEAQNFSNKLLILIDGRSVYSPLYSGVYLDVQDVLLEDVDRIEVISGPGATLWGANAMNGVINIITRPAYLTDGAVAKIAIGNQETIAGGRFGDKVGENGAYRVYVKAFERDEMELASGAGAADDWNKLQAGFRSDWTGAQDTVTAQGDFYQGHQNVPGPGQGEFEGANVVGRWTHRRDADEFQLQGYYDYTKRAAPPGGVAFSLNTFDVELQHSLQRGAHRLIWGAGARFHDYEITNSEALSFDPSSDTLLLANVFAEDTISLTPSVDFTVGLKAERDPFSGWNPLPDLRLAWKVNERAFAWVAASRAIRSPTPFDSDVVEKLGGVVFLTGNDAFEPEQVNAFEVGYRVQPTDDLSITASVFYNVYDDLRTIEPSPGTVLPLRWGNLMEGHTYGFEAWAKWQVTDNWRIAPGVRMLKKDLEFADGASGLVGLSQSGNDPRNQALLTSSLNLTPRVSIDATLRYVDALPEPHLDSYTELNAAIVWHAWEKLDVALSGTNLLDSRHLEYPEPSGEYIRRSVLAHARWRF